MRRMEEIRSEGKRRGVDNRPFSLIYCNPIGNIMLPRQPMTSHRWRSQLSIADSRQAAQPKPRRAVAGREFLTRSLSEAVSREGIALIVLPAPPGDPSRADRLFRLAPDEPGVLWDGADGGLVLGLGAVRTIRTAGPERVERLKENASRLLRTIRMMAHPDCRAYSPALFGGFAFAEGGADADPWRDFGDSLFTLPRWCYRSDGDEATLSRAADPDAPHDSEAILAEYDTIVELLESNEDAPSPPPPGNAVLNQMEEGRWVEMVETIRDIIASGEMTKIVAARLSEATIDKPIDVYHLLSRLGSSYPRCYRFAFRTGQSVFLGATPERLARKKGHCIWTEALAGSIGSPRSGNAAGRKRLAAELLASEKDRAEHAIVVESIGRRLGEICSSLSLPDRPSVVELRHVMHLHTPIAALLKEEIHLLDLISTLHPTPSVGGVPTDRAIDWIVRNEPDPRGWYAGPIGWFDSEGDGEFAVALRCGLIRQNRAYLYAGAGIVRDSDPIMEFAETNIKQKALLRALGITV